MNNYVRENRVREFNVSELLSPPKILFNLSTDFFGISDLRSVDNCIK